MAFDPLQLQAGDLRHSITIQAENTGNLDAAGNPSSTWTNVLTTRAKIEGTTSPAYRAMVQAQSIASQATALITIRWPGRSITISPGMRIHYGDNTYQVQAVDNILLRNRIVRLLCMAIDKDSN